MENSYCEGDILTWKMHNGEACYALVLDASTNPNVYILLLLNWGETMYINKVQAGKFATRAV